uniref:Uncharacterized protein MANES_15G083000 n=2 Tax=Rhizophora mucronata TaxID=61149 RepID=A0A2P2J929_RHIMU
MVLNNSKDHWAFLEEIEAPMWVDLFLEAKSNCHDIDDRWFQTSHQFHQCSSRQLKASFSNSIEGSLPTDFDSNRLSSPNLPSSVSRSRGKHYTSKKWRGDDFNVLLNKQHPVKGLNGKSPSVTLDKKMKPKSSFTNSKGTARSKTSLVSNGGLPGNAKSNNLKAALHYRGLQHDSSSAVDKAVESTSSTITSLGSQQPEQKGVSVSSEAFGHTSGLLSSLRISLRKSCVTRQASRVKINDDSGKQRERKSSSSKSSVGSSSHPGNDFGISTFTYTRKKEYTPDSRNVARMTKAAKQKITDSFEFKASNVRAKEGGHDSRRRDINNVRKLDCQQAASKVQNQTLSLKALVPYGVNVQGSLTGARNAMGNARVGRHGRYNISGKENVREDLQLSQKLRRDGGGMVRSQNVKVLTKNVGTGLLGPKGNVSSPSKGKRPTNAVPRVYFR